MKIFCFGISILMLFATCSSDIEEKKNPENKETITFIADFRNPKAEVFINKMIRNSTLEKEYLKLKQNDTIILNSIGRSFYMLGLRNTVYDSLVIDMGDTIKVSIENDSVQYKTSKSNLGDNLKWLGKYQYEVEGAYAILLEQITDKYSNLDFLKTPFVMNNHYQTFHYLYSHIYKINRTAYNEDKFEIDSILSEKYTEFNSQINDSNLDLGSKQIMQYLLFNSTIDKFNRMRSTALKKWMYNKINDEIQKDCSFQMNT